LKIIFMYGFKIMKSSIQEKIGESAFLFRSALCEESNLLIDEICRISELSPFRQMRTRRGVMSVEMTNCGTLGWLSDTRGYRYTEIDPLTRKHWPPMSPWVQALATQFALRAGFAQFHPNACLINKYIPGMRLGMHRDNDEGDTGQPIVAFSFGLPALFRWGGVSAKDPTKDILISQGDVLVWGREDRLRYHGIHKVYDEGLQTSMNERLVMTFRYSRLSQHN